MDNEKPTQSERPHYHAWRITGRHQMAYMSRAFGTKQAATAYIKRREPDPAFRFVKRCDMGCHCPRPPKKTDANDK